MGVYNKGRAASEVPGIALKAVSDDFDCARRSKYGKRKVRKESHSKQMIEADKMVYVQMRKEKPANSHETSGPNRVQSPAV